MRLPSQNAGIDLKIVERSYWRRAIRMGKAFEHDCACKSLVVLATGAGQTSAVIA